MNKLIGIAAILTIAMFASGALADATTAYVALPTSFCGATASGTIGFGTVAQGTTSPQESVTLTNSGTIPTTGLTVYGTDWSDGIGHTMLVGQTQVYDTNWNALQYSTGFTIFGGAIGANGGTVTPIFTVTIPANQLSDGTHLYSQIITFTGTC